jgi:hypothetical protein
VLIEETLLTAVGEPRTARLLIKAARVGDRVLPRTPLRVGNGEFRTPTVPVAPVVPIAVELPNPTVPKRVEVVLKPVEVVPVEVVPVDEDMLPVRSVTEPLPVGEVAAGVIFRVKAPGVRLTTCNVDPVGEPTLTPIAVGRA